MDRAAYLRTMRVLDRRYRVPDWAAGMTPFEVLLSTVLSQSTTVANERRGMEGLRSAFGHVRPESVAAATEADIARAIWHAGLARQKAPRIRAIARHVLEAWAGDLRSILAAPTPRAREALLSLPGVGPKTADVVLAMAGGHSVFPVDTHVARVARRWRIAPSGGYEGIRGALERWTPPRVRKRWHLAMIAHGRSLCKARAPRCPECPVSRDCDWYRERTRRPRSKRLKAKRQ